MSRCRSSTKNMDLKEDILGNQEKRSTWMIKFQRLTQWVDEEENRSPPKNLVTKESEMRLLNWMTRVSKANHESNDN